MPPFLLFAGWGRGVAGDWYVSRMRMCCTELVLWHRALACGTELRFGSLCNLGFRFGSLCNLGLSKKLRFSLQRHKT